MSYFMSFMKLMIANKAVDLKFEAHERRAMRLLDLREERATRLLEARELARRPKMVSFSIDRAGSPLGRVRMPLNEDSKALVAEVEALLPPGERIVEHSLMDNFYFMKSSSGVIIKARLD